MNSSNAAPASLLFEDDFNRGIPGWTQVQPAGNYIDGPLRWQYDIVTGEFLEQSNIYTDAAGASPSATAVMLINDAVAGTNFTYKARLTAGDDDAFGLIFGYANANNFFRVTFTRQLRTEAGFPWNGWNIDRKVNNAVTNLFGDGVDGVPDSSPVFRNTQYQPFDVTISVTDGLLSLTVLDDPEGARTEYRLVEAQRIAGLPAAGRVGLMTWGQSGTALRGFRIGNLSLAPTVLSDNPNALTNWTPVVPPRGDGSGLDPASGNGGRPIWSLAVGQNGSFGTLHENSDSYGGNDSQGQVDFTAPSIVAGDVNWSNYVVKARILPVDDDGHGLLLRYLDESNFYRIALRSQDSATGPRKGLSIQKVVGGVYEQVYHDDPVKYDPIPNIPYEMTAAVVGNRMQILLIANPGAATSATYTYGPFELSGNTVPKGRIGFFSWGMSRTEFDWVRVYSSEGVPLEISSAHGSPEPAAGIHSFPPGSAIHAAVQSPVTTSSGVRQAVTGWTGLGSAPVSGTATDVTFTLNDISLLAWTWQTEYQLSVSSEAGGAVSGPGAEWLPAGAQVSISARANSNHVFTGWTGSSYSLNSDLQIRVSGPQTLTARFEADADNDQLADPWELHWFGNTAPVPGGDDDNDGVLNVDEYRRGTSPNAAEPVLLANQLTSRWENVQRDPALPGWLIVRDFGSGFRGLWENSNDFREAQPSAPGNLFIDTNLFVANVSFEGPRMIVRPEAWDPAWSNFTGSAIFDFGDNDGGCVYFRYVNESNWYRVTITGENNNAAWRAPFGLSIQKRVDGVFAELGRSEAIAGDPTDAAFYKRVRVIVAAEGENFTVTCAGWNTRVTPAEWDTATQVVYPFADSALQNGRFGVGFWGQSGGNTAIPGNPVNAGMLVEAVTIAVNGNEVFREDWTEVPLGAELPAGWTNVMAGTSAAGTWQRSAHGAIIQTGGYAPASSGTSSTPRADADSSMLISPPVGSSEYLLELGMHPFDNDGIGFVYDFQDTNNFARVMFVSEATAAGRIPQGLSVSRKTGGAWTDIVAGDPTFVYTPGQPFMLTFSRQQGAAHLRLWEESSPGSAHEWSWQEGTPAHASNRFGFSAWGQQDAHFTRAAAYKLVAASVREGLRILSARVLGSSVELTIENPSGAVFDVESSSTLDQGSWAVLAPGQTGTNWSGTMGGERMFFRLVTR